MTTISAAEAKKSICALVDEVALSHHPVQIVGKRNIAVLISEEDWRAIGETLNLTSNSFCSLPGVNVLPVPNLQYQYGDDFILNGADDAVVSETIAPQVTFVTGQSLAGMSWIVGCSYALPQEPSNGDLCCPVELSKLLGRSFLELNAPNQVLSPSPLS